MVKAAASLKARVRKFQDENEKVTDENDKIKREIESLKRYNQFMDDKLADVTKAEEEANHKILKLLDDVSALTLENQNLLKIQT